MGRDPGNRPGSEGEEQEMISRIRSIGRRLGPLGSGLAAAALTAAALAAVSVAQNDSEQGEGEGDRFEFRIGHGPGGPESLSQEERDALEAHRRCMVEQGAPVPPRPGEIEPGERRPPEPPSEADRENIEEALEACADELPEGIAFPPGCGLDHDDDDGAREEGEEDDDRGEAEDEDEPGDSDS